MDQCLMGCLVSSNETSSIANSCSKSFCCTKERLTGQYETVYHPASFMRMKVPKLQLRKLNDTENALLIDDKRFMQSLLKAFNGIDENDTNVGEKAGKDNSSARLETSSMASATRRERTNRSINRSRRSSRRTKGAQVEAVGVVVNFRRIRKTKCLRIQSNCKSHVQLQSRIRACRQ